MIVAHFSFHINLSHTKIPYAIHRFRLFPNKRITTDDKKGVILTKGACGDTMEAMSISEPAVRV